MAGRLSGKVALISGGASGIGAATAQLFEKEGARIVIGDINIEKGRGLADRLGEGATFVELDVTSPESWNAAINTTKEQFGEITSLVNSAGVSIPGSVEEISLEDFRKTISINLEGTFLGTQAGIRALKHIKGAAIVNVASTLGHRGGAFIPAYCASKGGVRMFTRSVALHCAENRYDIRVNTISPGAIHTEMVDAYIDAGIKAGSTAEDVIKGFADGHPLKRLGTPEEPANAIVFLASNESSYSTGIDIPVDGGYLA